MSAGDQIWTLVGRLTLPVVASFILVLLGARISTPEWAFIATVATLVLVRYAVLQAAGHLRAAGGFFCTGLVGTATAITIMTAFTPVEHLSKVMDTISTTGYSLGACWTVIGLILGSQSVPSLCRVGVLIAVVVCQGLYNGTAYMKTGDERSLTFVLPMEASCSAFGTLFARVLWCHWERQASTSGSSSSWPDTSVTGGSAVTVGLTDLAANNILLTDLAADRGARAAEAVPSMPSTCGESDGRFLPAPDEHQPVADPDSGPLHVMMTSLFADDRVPVGGEQDWDLVMQGDAAGYWGFVQAMQQETQRHLVRVGGSSGGGRRGPRSRSGSSESSL